MTKKTYKIKEISTLIKRGITPSYTEEFGVKVINQKCIRDFKLKLDLTRYTNPEKIKNSNEKYLKPFDVLINSTGVGTLGRVAQISEINNPITADSHVTIVRPNVEIMDPIYFGYCLKSKQKHIELLGEGSTGQTELSRLILGDMELSVVKNIIEQKVIGNFFEVIDKKIDLIQKMNETLEETTIMLFKSWFIDFEPVKRKIKGISTGLSIEINDLFPDIFETTEFGKIPKGWSFSKFGDLIEPKRGKIITKSTIQFGVVPVVAGGIKPAYYHSKSNATSPVVTISASGNAGFVNLYYKDIWASDCSYINKDITDYIYFSHSFLKINQNKIFHLRHGAVQQHINPKDLMGLDIVIPSISLIGEYEKIVTPIHKKISNNQNEINILSSLRNLLLPKLISGELKIFDSEKFIEQAST